MTFHENEDNLILIPIAIQCCALDGDSPRQAHTTVASFERTHEGAYVLKNIKQKLYVDGLSYLLQEIYGLENKMADLPGKMNQFDDEYDDCGADCVVCMCDLRDTIILPCRHLCLCYACAESLRYQASNCPICRAPFIALLQIRAVQKMSHNTHPALAGTEPTAQEGVPPGYNSISLVEALNGPSHSANQQRENSATMVVAENPAVAGENPEENPAESTAAGTATGTHGNRFGHVKKSRGKRRGSKDPKPKTSGSVSSQMSNANPEDLSLNPTGGNDTSDNPENNDSNLVTNPTGVPAKIKSADTNVRVSLKIVNEVESTGKSPSLDIVEEELAKMAVAESLNDIPNQIDSKNDAVEEIDSVEDLDNEEDDDLSDDEADDEAEDDQDLDQDDLDDQDDEAVVVNLPITKSHSKQSNLSNAAPGLNPSQPGTPMSQTSERSSQNSATSSACSTKHLLPKTSQIPEGKTTPLQDVSKIVMVNSTKKEAIDVDEDLDMANEEFC